MTEELTLIDGARIFATQRHHGIFRGGTAREPYIIHCEETAKLVRASGGSDEEIAGAWLHDVVEDTATTLEVIGHCFGQAVKDIIDGMTDPSEFKHFSLIVRKGLQAERVKLKSKSIKRVKLADQISNIRSVAVDPPIEWDKQECLDYIRGAYLIAQECQGVSEYLNYHFDQAY